MNKKLQIFISSTYEDLIDERQAIVMAILDAGHIPAGMELFKGNNSVKNTIFKWIDNSDIYILLLGGRYGSIDAKTGKSYTQIEYEYAKKKRKPVFSIVLDETYLDEKAKKQGTTKTYEQKNKKLYKDFKKIVTTNIAHYVENVDQIGKQVISEINNIVNNLEYNMIGWTKLNAPIDDCNNYALDVLSGNIQNFIREYLKRTVSGNETLYADAIAKNITQILNVNAILDSVHREITLEIIGSSDMVKVTTCRTENFLYIKEGEPYFRLYNEMTKQQSETYCLEKILIDRQNLTSAVDISFKKNKDRGQFIYTVDSDFSPPPKTSCEVKYISSYKCPILDYFHSYRLSYPCENFSTTVIIKNDTDNKYSLLCSSFSAFSNIHYDDFKAMEVDNDGNCSIRLPKWSLPGAGYAVTVKRKSKENHI